METEVCCRRAPVCATACEGSAQTLLQRRQGAGGKSQGWKACERLRSRPKGADQGFQAGREISESSTRLRPSFGDLGGSSQVLESQGRAASPSNKRGGLRSEGDRRRHPFFPQEMEGREDWWHGCFSSGRLE